MRGEIAFVRRTRGYDELRIGNTSGGSKGSRLIVEHRSIVSAELSLTHVAYVVTGPGPISADGATSVRVRDLRTGAGKQVYRAVSTGANLAGVTRPTYIASPQGFMWARANIGADTGQRFVHYTLRDSKLAYAEGSPFLTSTAWAGTLVGAATSSAFQDTDACDDETVNICRVQLSGPLEFTLRQDLGVATPHLGDPADRPDASTMLSMSRIRSSLFTAAVAGAVLAPAAVAQGAPTTLAVEQSPTRVAAWDGVAMWSRLDPVTNRYVLVKSVAGAAPPTDLTRT